MIDNGEMPEFTSSEQPLPFEAESVELSIVLKEALVHNIDLRSNAIDVAINEANIMAAVGAYDVFLSASLTGTYQQQPQRGSAFTISTGSRELGGSVGFNRRLETGGTIDLTISATRRLQDQPVSFLNPAAGSIVLANYTIRPTLTLSHPLLKGAGLKVNRADIDRARLAKSQTEAQQMITAQSVVRDIVVAYWELLYAQRDLENKRRSLELAHEQLTRTEAEVAAGRRSPIDGRSLKQTVSQRENELLLAENNLLDRSLTLRTLMGQDLSTQDILGLTPATDPDALKPRPVDHKAEIELAMKANPQIRQLQLAIASRRIDEYVAANQRLVQLDVRASFSPQGRSVDRVPTAETGDPGEKGTWGKAFRNFFNDDISDGLLADYQIDGSINLTWDVQNRTPKANHQRAVLELHKAEANLSAMRQNISGQVIRLSSNLRNAAKRMEVTADSVELAEENLKAETARYSVGRSTSYDVMFRMDELELAQANSLRAQIDYLQSLTELQLLTGELLPAYGLEVVSQARTTPNLGKK